MKIEALGILVLSSTRRSRPLSALVISAAATSVIVRKMILPAFAPNHVANIKALAREHYYDDAAVVRTQDNYLVQISDPNAKDEGPSAEEQLAEVIKKQRGENV